MAAVLLDRDGVINENRRDYVTRWPDFRFLPGSLQALAFLHGVGLRLAIVTNQSAVGRGLMTAERLAGIHRRMLDRCRRAGAVIDSVFVCPHAPADGCRCRKPLPGLLLRAAGALGEPPERCVVVGDGVEDLLAAGAAGMPFVLVRTGRGEETLRAPECREHAPLFVAADLREASQALAARPGLAQAVQAA